MKKPLPSMARSRPLAVDSKEPWLNWVATSATVTP